MSRNEPGEHRAGSIRVRLQGPRGAESVPTRTGQSLLFVKETNTVPENAVARKSGGGGE